MSTLATMFLAKAAALPEPMADTTWSFTPPCARSPVKASKRTSKKEVLLGMNDRMRSNFAKNGPHLSPCKGRSYEQ